MAYYFLADFAPDDSYRNTTPRQQVAERDRKLAEKMLESKSVWLPDFNGMQMGLVVHALELLGIPGFITENRELRGNDADLVQMANNALSVKWQVKSVLGISLSDNDSPVVILRRLLYKLGLKLKYQSRDGTGDRARVYRVVGGDDGRDKILQHWLEYDG